MKNGSVQAMSVEELFVFPQNGNITVLTVSDVIWKTSVCWCVDCYRWYSLIILSIHDTWESLKIRTIVMNFPIWGKYFRTAQGKKLHFRSLTLPTFGPNSLLRPKMGTFQILRDFFLSSSDITIKIRIFPSWESFTLLLVLSLRKFQLSVFPTFWEFPVCCGIVYACFSPSEDRSGENYSWNLCGSDNTK